MFIAYANRKHPQNITKPLCNVTWWKFKNFQNFDGSPKVNDFSLFVCVKRDHRLPRGVLFCTSAISPADNHYFFRMVFEIGRRHVQRDLCMSHVCGKCKCPWWVPAQHILYHPAFFKNVLSFIRSNVCYTATLNATWKMLCRCATEVQDPEPWQTPRELRKVCVLIFLRIPTMPQTGFDQYYIRWDGCAVKNVILWYWIFHA